MRAVLFLMVKVSEVPERLFCQINRRLNVKFIFRRSAMASQPKRPGNEALNE